MFSRKKHISIAALAGIIYLLGSCKTKAEDKEYLFNVLDHKRTGLDFANRLKATPEFNMLKYMYFYNGAGVGAGDFNNDGLVDLFFASNQEQNKIYINKGGLVFKDVTEQAAIPNDGAWSTGISVADVNDDGMLDIYVCRVGHYESLNSRNQLLICKEITKEGIPKYKDEAAKYGLDFSGFSTQAAFLDYDMDGDLDMFLLNHSLRYNSTFAPRESYVGTADSLSGDILYRNDGGKFIDVSREAGINQSVIGYGLGIVVADINLDGYPDMYIGNDFHENDYLYINNRKGGFTEDLTQCTMHTSQFSMGVDIADINNDALPEIIAADMLPSDPYILKRSLGEDEYNTFQVKIRNGYNYQYARNTLQLNRGDGTFSETGLYSGIYATDWSWATLWMDFNNDGLKDLFISNGIPKRLNDIDYVNYVSNDEIQSKIRANQMAEKDMALIEKFPQIKLPNRFFQNTGNALFKDMSDSVPGNINTYSNGAAYADLDNDGDLDVVVNNIDEPALIYQNTTNDKNVKPSFKVKLNGPNGNRNALGSRLIIFEGSEIRLYEKYPVHGFQSSMELPLQVAITNKKIDSALLVWPDNSFEKIILDTSKKSMALIYKKNLPAFNFQTLHKKFEKNSIPVRDISSESNLNYRHEENQFIEFDREPLMPFMASREGPAMAVGDMNGDGLDDIFVGSSKGEKPAVFTQLSSGKFVKSNQPALDADSVYEETDACWADFNNDGITDLALASGGNEYYGSSEYLLPRLFINDGQGNLVKKPNAFKEIFVTTSTIIPYDFDGDGKMDLFIGGRSVPFEYGRIPSSYLLKNNGEGSFTDVTKQYANGLENAGFVKGAIWTDLDGDKDMDLVLSLEWDGILSFINEKGHFNKKYLTDKKGWWNFALPFDADNDGDLDLLCGNEGLNSRLTATDNEPVRFYYYDFDNNGKKEQIITYYINGKELPFASKTDLEKQMPFIKKRYLYAEDFAKASLMDIFDQSKLQKAELFQANYFSNALLINNGKNNFTLKELPWQAQLTTYKDAVSVDLNKDKFSDVLLFGNFYPNTIQMGRNDADYGTILVNNQNVNFSTKSFQNFQVKGEVRHIKPITINKTQAYVLGRNDDSLKVIRF